MNPRAFFFLAAALAVFQGTASASTEEAEKCLQTAVKEVISAADHASSNSALTTSVTPILKKYISFDAMTRHAVGPGWRQFHDGQQKEAIRLFTTLIIRTYSSKFTPGEHPVITFKTATSPAPGRVEIPTTLLYEGSHYDVTYRLENVNGWRITDVVIEGVSLIANYRTQFDAQFKEGGANAVVDALTRSAAENNENTGIPLCTFCSLVSPLRYWQAAPPHTGNNQREPLPPGSVTPAATERGFTFQMTTG